MWLPASNERAPAAECIAGDRAAAKRRVGTSIGACFLAGALAYLVGCGATPHKERARAPAAGETSSSTASPAPVPASSAATSAGAGTSAAAGTPVSASNDSSRPGAPRPEVPPAARADFDRALGFMRAGNATEAELGFKQVAVQYPQFAAPLVNVAILERKAGALAQAEDTLKSAVSRESGSAVAWTELGATQRMRGEFTQAAASYEQAIAADARYAPAWRNLGVLEDLYLQDPSRALRAFEQYKQLTGEEKPVSGWIAELRQRLGVAPAKRSAASDAAAPAAPGESAPPRDASAPDTQPQSTAPHATDEAKPPEAVPPAA